MCLAKFDIPEIDLKILVSCFNDIRYLDLCNHTSKMFFQPPLELRQIEGKKVHTQWGVTWSKKSIYITDTSIDMNDRELLKSSILELDIDGNLIRELPLKGPPRKNKFDKIFSRPHQLQYYKGDLFLVDTGHNCIKIIDCDTCEYKDLIPFPGRFGSDIDHINALSISDDDKLYVSALNGKACVYDIDGKNINRCRNLQFTNGIHNIFVLYDKVCVQHSPGGTIINEDKSQVLNIGTYNRGIVITDQYIVVGQSAISEQSRRGDSNHVGSILIFDKKTKKKIGKVSLPQAGQVLEIRCLDQKDYAHYGKPFFSD